MARLTTSTLALKFGLALVTCVNPATTAILWLGRFNRDDMDMWGRARALAIAGQDERCTIASARVAYKTTLAFVAIVDARPTHKLVLITFVLIILRLVGSADIEIPIVA